MPRQAVSKPGPKSKEKTQKKASNTVKTSARTSSVGVNASAANDAPRKTGCYVDKFKPKHRLPHGTKYDTLLLPVLQNMAALGYNAADMGAMLGHTGDQRQFIKNMQISHPEAKEAIQAGIQQANINLVAQAYKAGCGYDYQEIIEEYHADGTLKGKKVITKHKPPESNLLQFLLCNRMSEDFSSVHRIEVDRKDTTTNIDVSVTSEQISTLGGKLLELANERKAKYVDAKVIDGKEEGKTKGISSSVEVQEQKES